MTTTTDRYYGLNGFTAWKPPAKVATTANITLSGAQTIDGVAVVAGDRVLVKDQTDGSENGIWIVASGAWTRATDWNGARDVVSGTAVLVTSGTANSGTAYYISTSGTISVGTTSITFGTTQVLGLKGYDIDTRADVGTTSIPAAVQSLRTGGYTTLGDGGGALYVRTASEPAHDGKVQSSDSAWWELVIDGAGPFPDQFGGTDETAIQSMMDWAALQTGPVTVRFRQGAEYTVGAKVDCDLPEHSTVWAHGAAFDCTADGVAFDLNPDATAQWPITVSTDTYTKRGIKWLGGKFTNSAGTKTASVAIQATMMRDCLIADIYATGFYAAVKFGGKDTYQFQRNFTFNCTRHYWVPAAGVLFTGSLTGNDLIRPSWVDCHMSITGNESAVYVENRVIDASLQGLVIAGEATGSPIYFSDNSTQEARGITIENCRIEQVAASTSAIKFSAAGGFGFRSVKIVSSAINWTNTGCVGVETDDCAGIEINILVVNGGGGSKGTGVKLDADSRDIRIHDGVRSTRSSPNFLNLATDVDLNGATRRDVELQPAYINLPNVGLDDGTTDLSNVTGLSTTAATTIDMSGVGSTIANSALPPVAYDIGVSAKDSGSAATTGRFIRFYPAGGAVAQAVRVDLGGVPNDDERFAFGTVTADANGDIDYRIVASGAGTFDVDAWVAGIRR